MKYGLDPSNGLEFGLYTLGDHLPNPSTGERIPASQRLNEIIELSQLAEQAGIDFFSVGESHQDYFTTQAHSVVLGAIAQATEKIKIASSSTIISTLDPVRVFEDFATIDLISGGRTELIAGRASRTGNFELLGYSLRDYEDLYEEKFDLLRQINEHEVLNWSGNFRAPLRDAHILPRPMNGELPIWRAVGGHPASAMKAGYAGVPMFFAALGGPVSTFKNTVDTFRQAASQGGRRSGRIAGIHGRFLLPGGNDAGSIARIVSIFQRRHEKNERARLLEADVCARSGLEKRHERRKPATDHREDSLPA
ncbi:LLM class flavin-dependent oxidoreductase [Salimicrobium sp. PL1-032A]|uniref:LLM class flavin-dependent oxidoreductase n=1 Tax=Salimicrobium sp. PL1-032A TaxID=3095364 RepID=UPI00326125B5